MVFIDHASYGRPFWLETAGVSPTFCPEEAFAGILGKEYCVASNTLAAVLYWCQGKEGCEVDPVRSYVQQGKEGRTREDSFYRCGGGGDHLKMPRDTVQSRPFSTYHLQLHRLSVSNSYS